MRGYFDFGTVINIVNNESAGLSYPVIPKRICVND
jgi:hypothetical protein